MATQSGTFSGTSSGTNTGNQTISIGGDVTAAGSTGVLTATVTKVNGVALSGLSTGLLKNTTTTGAPSIAIAGTDYAAASHTHTASQISDSTTAGRALLTGADAAAQRTSLGLGTMATQSSNSYSLTSHTHTSSDITNFNTAVSGLVSGVYAPLSGATFTGAISSTSGSFSNGISITGGSLSINTSGQSYLFSTRYGANSVGSNIWVGNGGASAIGAVGTTYMGSYNSAFGVTSLNNNTTGFQNCAFGHSSLVNNTTGYYNSAFGQASLQTNITGLGNCAFGINALLTSTTSNNSAFGFCSMQSTTTGNNNSAFGTTSLFANTTGSSNCAFGAEAGRYINSGAVNQTSSTSIYIGNDSRASANGNTNEIVIGSTSRGNGSNTVTIGNSSIKNNFFNGTIIANSIAGNASSNNVVDGRLTIYTGDPIGSEVGNTFGSTLYFTPFNGNRISLYDTTNSRWQIHTFSQISISLATGYSANTMYDVFIYDNAGTKTLELTAWTTQGGFATPTATASARSTGSVLALQDGVYVKSGSPNKRYLGTARTNATAGFISDGVDQRFLWNMYNRVSKYMDVEDATSHTYATGAFRIYRNQSSNKIEFVVGLDRYIDIKMTISSSSQSNPAASHPVGISIDITNSANSIAVNNNVDTATLRTGSTDFITTLSAGYHYLAMVQFGATGATFNNASIGATIQC